MATTIRLPFILRPLSAALLAATSASWAQAPSAELPAISVTGRSTPAAGIGGFGNIPLAVSPFQASSISAEQIKDRGFTRLADVTKVDPAVSDAYNSEGYWDQIAIRGYTLDNRFNFRRDGLPISAETSIPLDNKSRIEVLKGTSGIQSGTSAPGGLVNYVVKRPTDAPVRSVELGWRSQNSLLGAVDIGQRFGNDNAFGLRVNAAYENLAPQIRDMDGHRNLLSVAGDWRISPDTLIEAEIETSQRKQRSQPGFSLLGPVVPAPGNPNINLNNQPWSQPNVMEGNTGSLRLQQTLTRDWKLTAHGASQQLRSDDRLAYPFGCSAENSFDRYCSDGSFDYYDFRSDGERRRSDALDLSVTGQLHTGTVKHELTTGVLRTNVRTRTNAQSNNFLLQPGNVDGTAVVAPDATLNTAGLSRDERSTELYVRDAIQWTERFGTWLGVRHSRISRKSIDTDLSGATDYSQSFTTPWLAATYAYVPGQIVYASWGRGIESEVVANRQQYTNAGAVLPNIESRQFEIGLKGSAQRFNWELAAFDIKRPTYADAGACDPATPGTCTRQADGTANHRGVEASLGYEAGAWEWRGGAQLLRARREGSMTVAINGMRPVNVPETTLKLEARYNVAAAPGLSLLAGLVHEGDRMALADNSLGIPSWTRVDLGLRYRQNMGSTKLTWRAGIDNLFDKRAWRESPTQFGHVYLYPLAERAFRVSLQADL